MVDGFDVPVIKHPPVSPFVNVIVLGPGTAPQSTVIGPGAVIVGSAAADTVIVLDTDASALPQSSVAVHVSVTVPPHAPGVEVKVDGFDVPVIRHPPDNPFVNVSVLGPGTAPQSTVIGPGAVIVGNAAGLTVMILDTGASVLPQSSVAVQVSVTVPPHAPGVAVKIDAFDVPVIKHPPDNPFVNVIVLGPGIAPQSTVIAGGAVIVGSAAGLTVIILDTDASGLSH